MDEKQGGKRYWFAAKTYGIGWGFPATWEGWVVLAVWLVVTLGGVAAMMSMEQVLGAYGVLFVMGAVLSIICWLKGEPMRWRWGGKEE